QWQLREKPAGYLGSLAVGVTFAIGWTPCVGPILGAILSLASTAENVGRGVGLLVAYSAGLGLPFLLAAAALGPFLRAFRRYRPFIPVVERAAGVILVVVGVLVFTNYYVVLNAWAISLTPARGLGSSAAAWVGGLVAGNALLGSPLTKDALLALAARAEGHPDNVAAALFGGLTVSSASGPTVTAVSLPVPAGLRWVALIPEVTSATAQARAVLPASVPYHDAVFNVQRVALLLASLWAGRPAALAAALEDRLHEPYRLRLFPWMPEVVRAARAAGALGCVLSGAGPSLLAVVAGD